MIFVTLGTSTLICGPLIRLPQEGISLHGFQQSPDSQCHWVGWWDLFFVGLWLWLSLTKSLPWAHSDGPCSVFVVAHSGYGPETQVNMQLYSVASQKATTTGAATVVKPGEEAPIGWADPYTLRQFGVKVVIGGEDSCIHWIRIDMDE